MNCPKCVDGGLQLRYCLGCGDQVETATEHLHTSCPRCGFMGIEQTGRKQRVTNRLSDVPVICLTPEQACDAMQIGRDQFDVWSHRQGFPVIREGKVIRVPIDSLQEWLRQQATLTNGEPETLADRVAGFRTRSA